MQKQAVLIKTLSEQAKIPVYSTSLSAGADMHAAITQPQIVKAGEQVMIPTGLAMAIPTGFEVQIRPRSGLAAKHGLTVLNTPGTIDADYRGEIKIILINHGQEDFTIEPQMRIAQMILCPVLQADFEVVEELDQTDRGIGGFGSTGH